MNRDTFWSQSYRGDYIQGCHDRDEEREIINVHSMPGRKFKSVHAAKCAIAAKLGPQMWTYRGVDVYPADRNSSGIRWYARTASGKLRSDCKQMMRFAINELAPADR